MKWFESYLADRHQFVNLDGSVSDMALMKLGVPQCSMLSPLFFTVFINDLPLHAMQLLWNQSLRRWYHNLEVSRMWQHGRTTGISQYIRIRSFYWALPNRLPLNEKETKIFTVKGKRLSTKINSTFRITYNGGLLTNVMNVKLLGLEIGEGISFSDHCL